LSLSVDERTRMLAPASLHRDQLLPAAPRTRVEHLDAVQVVFLFSLSSGDEDDAVLLDADRARRETTTRHLQTLGPRVAQLVVDGNLKNKCVFILVQF
jgi:hypothetical protein